MRLYHPTTLSIISEREDIPKRYLTSVWFEIFKWKVQDKEYSKMLIKNDFFLGVYLQVVYYWATQKGIKLNVNRIKKLGLKVEQGFLCNTIIYIPENFNSSDDNPVLTGDFWAYFENDYLFSDACFLYFKGINIFPDIFGNDMYIKQITIEIQKQDGDTALCFLDHEKLKNLMQDDKTTIKDFLGNIIAQEALK